LITSLSLSGSSSHLMFLGLPYSF
jgi:hypothetical protein